MNSITPWPTERAAPWPADWLVDFHMHTGEGRDFAEFSAWLSTDPPYSALPSAGMAAEANRLFDAVSFDQQLSKHLLPIAGLHPWHADKGLAEVEALKPYLERSPIIGEIGLDRPWCHVPLEEQLIVLRAQLRLAGDWRRPVLLHSKGYEAELLAELETFTEPVIVHWFSCEDSDILTAYIERGAYFTLGPDNGAEAGTRELWSRVSPDRILLETDGLAAIAWAENPDSTDHNLTAPGLLASLETRVEHYARLHQLERQAVISQIRLNVCTLLE